MYDAAVLLFERAHQLGVAAYCRVNQALSALDSNHPKVAEVLHKANSAFQKHPTRDSVMLLKTRSISGIKAEGSAPQDQRRVSQWVFDRKTNTLTEKPGVTSVGASPFVFLDGEG